MPLEKRFTFIGVCHLLVWSVDIAQRCIDHIISHYLMQLFGLSVGDLGGFRGSRGLLGGYT